MKTEYEGKSPAVETEAQFKIYKRANSGTFDCFRNKIMSQYVEYKKHPRSQNNVIHVVAVLLTNSIHIPFQRYL